MNKRRERIGIDEKKTEVDILDDVRKGHSISLSRMVLREIFSVKLRAYHAVLIVLVICTTFYIFAFSNFFDSYNMSNEVFPREGLKTDGSNFTLDKKPFRIMSGSLHYFRVPQMEWSDRLQKLKGMGLNTVDIYIPWNLHEPIPGKFNFDDGLTDLTGFLDLLQVYELYGIVRPGPYICSEWDLGGLPSWLLRDKNMELRSMYPGYIDAVDRYFDKLLPLLKPFQFSYGGPVIAFQIENEYGTFGTDTDYMNHLRNLLKKHDLNELHFVCDNDFGLGKYKLDGVLQTINLMAKTTKEMIKKLHDFQPNKPVFVTELWDGWFDHWGEKHHQVNVNNTINALKDIIEVGGSFNLYMWHGGTNFGFMNGANANDDGSNYQCDITSYDYDAPLNEMGDETEKYKTLQQFIASTFPGSVSEDTYISSLGLTNYGNVELTKYLNLNDILRNSKPIKQEEPSSMETLENGKDYGQLYGYIVYQISIKHGGKSLNIERPKDFAVVLLNDRIVYTGSLSEPNITVQIDGYLKRDVENVLQIIVENCGRVNYGMDINNQRKGILGSVSVDGNVLLNWEIYSLEFQKEWLKTLSTEKTWRDFDSGKPVEEMKVPSILKGNLFVHHTPKRTLITLPELFKGVVFVNGINIGRYWNVGPQKTLYIPAEFLKMNNNEVLVFDLHGTTKKYGAKEYPTISSTHERDIGEKTAVSFLI